MGRLALEAGGLHRRPVLADALPVETRTSAALGGALATAVTGLSCGYPLGLTNDSAAYLSASQHLLSGHYTDYTGTHLSLFPPGYPVLLALGRLLGLGGDGAAFVVALGCAFVLGAALATFVRSATASPIWALATVLLVAVSPPWRLVTARVWSEQPYLALLCVFLVHALSQRPARRYAAVLGVDVALLTLTRWVGLVLLPVALLLVLRRERAGKPLLVGASAALLPVLAWLAANQVLGSSLSGPRPGSTTTPGAELTRTAAVVLGWMVPGGAPQTVSAGLVALAAVAMACAGLARAGCRGPLAVVLGAGAVQAAAQLTLTARTATDLLDDRLLAPVALCLVVALTLSAHAWTAATTPAQRRRWAVALPAGAAVLWLASDAQAATPAAPSMRAQAAALRSELAARADCRLWVSDEPATVSLATGAPVVEAPRTHIYRSDDRPDDVPAFLARVHDFPAGTVCFALTDGLDAHIGAAELQRLVPAGRAVA